MQFLNPSILYFLGALVIPIIIHLFYFRRYKKVHFSDTRFLFEAKEVQKNASRLKHLLVLFSRLLAMAFLILAFAQPYKSARSTDEKEANHISFFIDNSFSMEAGGIQQSLLEEAKRIAIRSVQAYPDHYSFHIFDHCFAGEDQQWIDKDKAINKIKRTALTGAVKTLSQIVGRQKQMLNRIDENALSTFIITDGQKNIFSSIPDFDQNDALQFVMLKPVVAANISIDSVWIEDPVVLPGQSTKLFVKLSNHGSSPILDAALAFSTNGQTKPASSFNLPARSSVTDTMSFSFSSSGWKELRLSISDASIEFDDEMLVSVHVADRIRILLINENQHEPFYRAAVQGNQRTDFDRKPVQNLVYSDFNKYDLIVVDGLKTISSGLGTELNNFIRSGGNVLLFPSINSDIKTYNTFLNRLEVNRLGSVRSEEIDVLDINTSSYIFKNVYRRTGKNLKTPHISNYFSLQNNAVPGRETLLRLRNRQPYLVSYARDGGHLYLCMSPSDEKSSNILTSGAFFVPMLHRMSTSSKSGIAPYYTVGGAQPITISSSSSQSDPVYKLVGNIEIIPARYQRLKNINLYAGDQIDESGFYKLTTQDSTLATVAFNFNRSESDMQTYTKDEIVNLSPGHISVINADEEIDVAEALVSKSQHTTYWKYCILFALFFLLCEQIILRHLKA